MREGELEEILEGSGKNGRKTLKEGDQLWEKCCSGREVKKRGRTESN